MNPGYKIIAIYKCLDCEDEFESTLREIKNMPNNKCKKCSGRVILKSVKPKIEAAELQLKI